jgi:ribosomal protein L37E
MAATRSTTAIQSADYIICPRCGARVYRNDVACQLCGYFIGSDTDCDDAGP